MFLYSLLEGRGRMNLKTFLDRFFNRFKLFQSEKLSLKTLVSEYKKVVHYIFLTQEKDKKRISEHLHECLSNLSTLRFYTDMLEKNKLNKEIDFAVIVELIDSTIKRVNTLINTTRPIVIDQLDISRSIHFLCRHFERKGNVQIKMISQNNKEIFITDKVLKISIYRVVQTCIWKSIKVFGATVIYVSLENSLKITVEDNGKEEPVNKEFYKTLNLWINELVKLTRGSIKEERTKQGTNKTIIIWNTEKIKSEINQLIKKEENYNENK